MAFACSDAFKSIRDFFRSFSNKSGRTGAGIGGGSGDRGNRSDPPVIHPYLDVVQNGYLDNNSEIFPSLTPNLNLPSTYGSYYDNSINSNVNLQASVLPSRNLSDPMNPLIWKNTFWSPTQAYALNEIVLFLDSNQKIISFYRYKNTGQSSSSSTPPPNDPSAWEFLTRMGDVSSSSSTQYRWRGKIDANVNVTSLTKGDMFVCPSEFEDTVFIYNRSGTNSNATSTDVSDLLDGNLNETVWQVQQVGLNVRSTYNSQDVYLQGDVVYETDSAKRAWRCSIHRLTNDSPFSSNNNNWKPLFPFDQTSLHFEGEYNRNQVYTDKSVVIFHGEVFVYSGLSSSRAGVYPSDFTILNASSSSATSGVWLMLSVYLKINTTLSASDIASYAPMQMSGFWNQGNIYKLNDMVILQDTSQPTGFSLYLYNGFVPTYKLNPNLVSTKPAPSSSLWTLVPSGSLLPYFGARPAPTFPLFGPDFAASNSGSEDTNQIGFLEVLMNASNNPARQFFSGKNVLNEVLAWCHFIQTEDGKKGIQSLAGNKYQTGMNNISLNILNGLMLLFGVDQSSSSSTSPNNGFFSVNSIQVNGVNYGFNSLLNSVFMSNPFLTPDGLVAGCVVHDRFSSTQQRFLSLQYLFPKQIFALPYVKMDSIPKETFQYTLPIFNPSNDPQNNFVSKFKNLLYAVQNLSFNVATSPSQTDLTTSTLPSLWFESQNKSRLQSFLSDCCWNSVDWSNGRIFSSYDALYAQMCQNQVGFSDSILVYYGGNISRTNSLYIPIYDYENGSSHVFRENTNQFSLSLSSPMNENCVDTLTFPNSGPLLFNEFIYPTRILVPTLSNGRKPFCGDLYSALRVCSGESSSQLPNANRQIRPIFIAEYVRKAVLDRIGDVLRLNLDRYPSSIDFCLFQMGFNLWTALALGSVMKHPRWWSLKNQFLYVKNNVRSSLTLQDVVDKLLKGQVGPYCDYQSVDENTANILIRNGSILKDPSTNESLYFRFNVRLDFRSYLGETETKDVYSIVEDQTFFASVGQTAWNNQNADFVKTYI